MFSKLRGFVFNLNKPHTVVAMFSFDNIDIVDFEKPTDEILTAKLRTSFSEHW